MLKLLLFLAAFPLSALAVPAAEPAIHVDHNLVDKAVLFAFDDHSIPFNSNLILSMEEGEKYPGNPVVPIGRIGEPDEWQIRYYGTVLREEGKFRMWYVAMSRDDFSAAGVIRETGSRFAYAESADGIHWAKPHLGLTEFRGSKENNLIAMPEGFRGYHILVVRQPAEPDPSRRYKMMARIMKFGPFSVPEDTALHGAYVPLYSPDGLRWRIADELTADNPKALSPRFRLVTHFEGSGLYFWKGMYYLSGQSTGFHDLAATSPHGRHIQMFRSPDLLNWSETQTMGFAREGEHRHASRTDEGATGLPIDLEQTHEGASVWVRGNVLLAITGYWHGSNEWMKVTHDLGLIISNDGLHFREPVPDFLIARVSPDGQGWDTGGLAQAQGFENVGDRTYFWYGQMDQREGNRTGRPWVREGGIGLLSFGRDRFGSLSTRDPDRDGILMTSEISAKRPVRLWVNAEGIGPDSPLRIELFDESERPLPEYSGARAALLTHSGFRTPVEWQGGGPIDIKVPFKIQARFEGPERNAIRLYALYLGER